MYHKIQPHTEHLVSVSVKCKKIAGKAIDANHPQFDLNAISDAVTARLDMILDSLKLHIAERKVPALTQPLNLPQFINVEQHSKAHTFHDYHLAIAALYQSLLVPIVDSDGNTLGFNTPLFNQPDLLLQWDYTDQNAQIRVVNRLLQQFLQDVTTGVEQVYPVAPQLQNGLLDILGIKQKTLEAQPPLNIPCPYCGKKTKVKGFVRPFDTKPTLQLMGQPCRAQVDFVVKPQPFEATSATLHVLGMRKATRTYHFGSELGISGFCAEYLGSNYRHLDNYISKQNQGVANDNDAILLSGLKQLPVYAYTFPWGVLFGHIVEQEDQLQPFWQEYVQHQTCGMPNTQHAALQIEELHQAWAVNHDPLDKQVVSTLQIENNAFAFISQPYDIAEMAKRITPRYLDNSTMLFLENSNGVMEPHPDYIAPFQIQIDEVTLQPGNGQYFAYHGHSIPLDKWLEQLPVAVKSSLEPYFVTTGLLAIVHANYC